MVMGYKKSGKYMKNVNKYLRQKTKQNQPFTLWQLDNQSKSWTQYKQARKPIKTRKGRALDCCGWRFTSSFFAVWNQ